MKRGVSGVSYGIIILLFININYIENNSAYGGLIYIN